MGTFVVVAEESRCSEKGQPISIGRGAALRSTVSLLVPAVTTQLQSASDLQRLDSSTVAMGCRELGPSALTVSPKGSGTFLTASSTAGHFEVSPPLHHYILDQTYVV